MILRDFIKRYLSSPFTKLEEDVKFKDFQYAIQAIGELYENDDEFRSEINALTILITSGLYYQQVQDEGLDLPQRYRMNFIGAGVTASDIGAVTVVDIPAGGLPAGSIVLVNATPYNVLPIAGTTIYLVDCTVGNIRMNFPTAVGSTAIWGIKKIDATANTVILTPNGAETIDGAATQTIRFQWTEIEIFSDNANLFIK